MGRPSLLNDVVVARIVKAVRSGASREGAARCARVGRSTLQDWIRRGKEGEAPFSDFLDKIRQAEGEGEVAVVAHLLEQSAMGKTEASKVLLRRYNAEAWADKAPVVEQSATSNGRRDDALDLDIARSVVAALESRVA